MTQASPHIPVLLREVVESLAPRDGGVYVDGTFGAGGYSRALLETADCRVWGIDRDPAAIAELIASTAARMSPSANGSCPGRAPSRNARAASGSR